MGPSLVISEIEIYLFTFLEIVLLVLLQIILMATLFLPQFHGDFQFTYYLFISKLLIS